MHILVVEDEPEVRHSLQHQLSRAGFNVEVAADGEQGLVAGLTHSLDAAIVDLGLPKRPGMAVLRELRSRKRHFPILVLTARDGWQDKVAGLQAGADDYVCKPFRFEEVLARVHGLMRRANGWATPQLVCGPVALHMRTQVLTVHGEPVELTTYEHRLLEHLMLRAGQVIARLRRKLDPDDTLQPIETVYGGGYRFALARGPGSS
jgi:two-component system, OmpR family, response regulator PhoP